MRTEKELLEEGYRIRELGGKIIAYLVEVERIEVFLKRGNKFFPYRLFQLHHPSDASAVLDGLEKILRAESK